LYLHNPTVLNSALYFMTNNQLWKTDGTTSGTTLVKDNLSIEATTTKMVVFNTKLYFGSDYLLWSSDGTPTGTTAFPELPSSSFTNVQPFTDINGKLIIVPNLSNFGAISGRFWSCDNADNITLITVGTLNSYGNLFKFNDALYFEGSNPEYKLFRYGLPINLGTESYSKQTFRVHPNPTSDNIIIQTENGFFTDASAKIYNTFGQLVFERKCSSSNEITIDFSSQATGIYFVIIEEKGNKTTQKIIKE
jgi:Secretion system C-terminal sorting domain